MAQPGSLTQLAGGGLNGTTEHRLEAYATLRRRVATAGARR
jgi:hypothetical protein